MLLAMRRRPYPLSLRALVVLGTQSVRFCQISGQRSNVLCAVRSLPVPHAVGPLPPWLPIGARHVQTLLTVKLLL